MTEQPSEQEVDHLTKSADVAALMLAAAEDREAFDEMARSVTLAEAPGMLYAALELGGTLVRYSDQFPAKELLQRMAPALRDVATGDE